MRIAPSRRMTEPFSIAFSAICTDEGGVLVRTAEPGREGDLAAEARLRLLRQALEHRRQEEARGDRDDADPRLGEVARHRQRHRGHRALRGGIGELADLPLEGGDRRRRHHHPALAVAVHRRRPRHARRGLRGEVEGADEVDRHHPREEPGVVRPALAVDAPRRRRDPGAGDGDPRHTRAPPRPAPRPRPPPRRRSRPRHSRARASRPPPPPRARRRGRGSRPAPRAVPRRAPSPPRGPRRRR